MSKGSDMTDKPKHAGGRPTMYTEHLGRQICREISISTDGLSKVCADNPDFPNPKTIYAWRIDFPEFALMYDAAKRIQADLLAQEIMDIADNTQFDTLIKTNKDGEEYEVCNSEWIARSKLRVDTRKWIACKLLPKVYGEKVDHKHDVTVRQEDAIEFLK